LPVSLAIFLLQVFASTDFITFCLNH